MSEQNQAVADVDTTNVEMSNLTCNDFLKSLLERVSVYNANLLLNTAKVGTGLGNDNTVPLNKEEAKALCLAMIRKGGPAFQVGKAMYQSLN